MEEIYREKLEKEKKEIEECTFTPQITTKGKVAQPSNFYDLKEREEKLNQLKQRLMKHYTHTPQTNNFEFSKQRENFNKSVVQLTEKRQIFKKENEEKKMKKEVEGATFKPEISEYSKTLERDGDSVFDRLFKMSQLFEEKQKLRKKEVEQAEQEALQQPILFTKKVSPRKSITLEHPDASPIPEGEELPDSAHSSEHASPRPTKSPLPNPDEVVGRLWNDANKRKSNHEQNQIIQNILVKEMINKSSPNKNSIHLIKSKLERDVREAFTAVIGDTEKFINYAQAGRILKQLGLFKSGNPNEKRNEEEARIHDSLWKVMDAVDSGFTDYNNFKRIVLPILDPESFADSDNKALFRALKEEIRLISMNRISYFTTVRKVTTPPPSEFPFKPKINESSIQIAERLNNLEDEKLRKELSQKEQKQPNPGDETEMDNSQTNGEENPQSDDQDMSQRSGFVGSTFSRYEKILKKQEELNKKLEQERSIREKQQMKECTFKPSIKKAKGKTGPDPNTQSSYLPQGMNRFDYLYQQGKKEKKVLDSETTLDKEYKTHCTFKPVLVTKKRLLKEKEETLIQAAAAAITPKKLNSSASNQPGKKLLDKGGNQIGNSNGNGGFDLLHGLEIEDLEENQEQNVSIHNKSNKTSPTRNSKSPAPTKEPKLYIENTFTVSQVSQVSQNEENVQNNDEKLQESAEIPQKDQIVPNLPQISEISEQSQPVVTPGAMKGLDKFLERQKKAREEKDFKKTFFEKKFNKRSESWYMQDAHKKTTSVKPFHFKLEEREKNRSKPVLFVDVNLGNGKTGRIGVHHHDDPSQLALNFAQSYQIDIETTSKLEEMIRSNMLKNNIKLYNPSGSQSNRSMNSQQLSSRSVNKPQTAEETSPRSNSVAPPTSNPQQQQQSQQPQKVEEEMSYNFNLNASLETSETTSSVSSIPVSLVIEKTNSNALINNVKSKLNIKVPQYQEEEESEIPEPEPEEEEDEEIEEEEEEEEEEIEEETGKTEEIQSFVFQMKDKELFPESKSKPKDTKKETVPSGKSAMSKKAWQIIEKMEMEAKAEAQSKLMMKDSEIKEEQKKSVAPKTPTSTKNAQKPQQFNNAVVEDIEDDEDIEEEEDSLLITNL